MAFFMAIVSLPLPYQLANGQVVDATQIMADINQIANNVNANAAPATSGTSVLKGNGSGGTTAAVAGTDFLAPGSTLLNIQKFTATGTYTPTAGTKSVLVELVGGGGAGGGLPVTTGVVAASAGGGAGGYAKGYLTSAFSGVTVTIGAGGVGSSGLTGGNGAATSFGTAVAANGGSGGTGGNAIPVSAVGDIQAAGSGIAGVGTAGSLVLARGSNGGTGFYFTRPVGGDGGASAFGGGGQGIQNTLSAGNAATSPGAGGGGCGGSNGGTAFAGGNGAAGVCLVYEFA